jgi:ABC-type oligopeptide transport system ATPase subunit
MSLLTAKNLTKEFRLRRRATFTAVKDVSFDLAAGETLAIVGESGSGKSTTARMVARLLDVSGGSVEFQGRDVTRLGEGELRAFRSEVQVVFQDPYSSLNPRHTAERIISAPLHYQGLPERSDSRRLVRELMERVGLNPDHAMRYPSQFSGGQAQRIGIARALAVNPKLVICDEAVSALDVSVQAQVIELLMSLRRERGLSYIFIAHDLAVVRQIADRVLVMNGGEVVEAGTCREVFEQPRHEYTKTLLAAIPRINPEWERRRKEQKS